MEKRFDVTVKFWNKGELGYENAYTVDWKDNVFEMQFREKGALNKVVILPLVNIEVITVTPKIID